MRLTNEEERAVGVRAVALRGADASEFLIDEACTGGRLRAGESCAVDVRFHPTVGGDRRAELVVTTRAGDEVTVDLSGTGIVTASLSAPSPVREGDGEAEQTVVFTVSLSAPSTDPVSVEFETEDGTANADQDYEEQSGTVTFEPGDTEAAVSVGIIGDTQDEPDEETFFLSLVGPDGAEIGEGRRQAVIRDGDRAPSISVAPQTVEEGDEGSTEITFVASLSAPSGRSVSADFVTVDETATGGEDYGTVEGTVTWDSGDTERPITVQVFGDLLDEPDERFFLELSDLQGARRPETEVEITGTIVDNDPAPSLAISDARVEEGNPPGSIEFEISLSAVSGRPVTVHAATAQDPGASCMAEPGQDYDDRETDLTIPAGTLQVAFAVSIIGDTADEECSEERFLVMLSGPVNASIDRAQAVGTIEDDDVPVID